MKLLCIFFMIFQYVFASTAPDFPEPRHYFDGVGSNFNNTLNYIFIGRTKDVPEKVSMSFSHQNREWGYNWYLAGITIPNHLGTFSAGVSVYSGSEIPITESDSIAPYISSYSTDSFTSIYAMYSPKINIIDINFIANGKYRELVDISAQQISFDINLSSRYLLNRQIGIRTTNLVSTNYKWSTGKDEELAKYIGLYFIQPIGIVQLSAEYDLALNYSDLNILLGQVVLNLDPSLSIYATYRKSDFLSALSYGTLIQLSNNFFIDYNSKTESYEYEDRVLYSIGLGVNF